LAIFEEEVEEVEEEVVVVVVEDPVEEGRRDHPVAAVLLRGDGLLLFVRRSFLLSRWS
jgi:hypothetical protein